MVLGNDDLHSNAKQEPVSVKGFVKVRVHLPNGRVVAGFIDPSHTKRIHFVVNGHYYHGHLRSASRKGKDVRFR
jgi:hypothetical protein